MSQNGEHRRTKVAALQDQGDTILGMALLWAIPALAFVYALTRM